VRAAAAAQRIPLLGSSDNWGVDIQGRPDLEGITTSFRVVTHDYFDVMGIHVRRGRGFLPIDRADTERVVVINEAFAAQYYPDDDPVGRVLHTGFAPRDERGERIIGVVHDVAENRLTDPMAPARYMLYEQLPGGILSQTTFVLRAESAAAAPALVQSARGTLEKQAPRLAIHRATTMQGVFDRAVGPAGQVVTLVSLLAGLAIVLGAIGVYGAISQFVTRRSRDYGIQIALGLRPGRLVSQVMGRGLRLVVLGSAVGLLASAAVTRLLSSLLFGVTPADPAALGGAVMALLLVGALAALVPALRASRTDPVRALRQQ
jgi:putative ABC transport system permease protein